MPIYADAMIDMDFDNGADTTTALANHLFGKLATSPVYTIEKNLKVKETNVDAMMKVVSNMEIQA